MEVCVRHRLIRVSKAAGLSKADAMGNVYLGSCETGVASGRMETGSGGSKYVLTRADVAGGSILFTFSFSLVSLRPFDFYAFFFYKFQY